MNQLTLGLKAKQDGLPNGGVFLRVIFIFAFMKAIVITPKNQTEFKFLSDLLKKLDITSVAMNEEEIEDLGLSKILKTVDKTKRVSKERVMAKLVL